jgi:NAD(P)-dependent dehydrogenase (short-subunit alcohol dehydrogenase family)
MRKLIAAMKASLDGKIERTDGPADWVNAWSDDYGLTPQIDACILGGGMYPLYENTGPRSRRNRRSLRGLPAPCPQWEAAMVSLSGKKMVVIGGSRGIGRRIVEAGIRNGAQVFAVARLEAPLQRLAHEVPGVETLALDATDENASSKVFDVLTPDILILGGGVFPPAAPIHEQRWQQFSANWENDVKIAFNFCKAALSRPLPAGASVVLLSSGAALAGSPLSGGYAGAKRTQIFIANYSQKESDRLGLGVRFMAIAPRIVPDTDLGKHAITGYSRYLGISAGNFIRGMAAPPTACIVATAVIELVLNPDRSLGDVFIVSGKGLEAVAA